MKAGIPLEWLQAQVARCCERLGITIEEARRRFENDELHNDTSHASYVARIYLEQLDAPEPQAEVTSGDLSVAPPEAAVDDVE